MNTVGDTSVEDTWSNGGFKLSFKINFVDGDIDGWTVVMGLNYKVVDISVSVPISIHINFHITSNVNDAPIL